MLVVVYGLFYLLCEGLPVCFSVVCEGGFSGACFVVGAGWEGDFDG